MLKNFRSYRKSSFWILLASLGLVSLLFTFLFFKKIEESKNSISSYIKQREYELSESILENKNLKATSDSFSVLTSFNISAYEVYFGKKAIFKWPENSRAILESCKRPFEADLTFRGILVAPVQTCLSTSALIQGTLTTTSFFIIFLLLFSFCLQ